MGPPYAESGTDLDVYILVQNFIALSKTSKVGQ